MEAIEKLQSAITMVNEARSVPLSASCVVHRGEMLELLEEINQALPKDLSNAQRLLGSRETIIEEGRQSAEQLLLMLEKKLLEWLSRLQLSQLQGRSLQD